MKTAIAQMEILPGRPVENCAKMLKMIECALSEKADLIVFPELAIPGYLVGDEWERESFLKECEKCADEIRMAAHGIVAVFGSVATDWARRNEDGLARKYNALFVAENNRFLPPRGGTLPFVAKMLMPNYSGFDDSRHFFDLRKLAVEQNKSIEQLVAPIKTDHFSIGCSICEDRWGDGYTTSPLDLLAGAGADIYVNISSSPYAVNKNIKRQRFFSAQAEKIGAPLIYANNVGIQNNGKTVFCFEGSSCVYDGLGNVEKCADSFEEKLCIIDIPPERGVPFGAPVNPKKDGIPEVYKTLSYGTEKFMELCGIQKVVIGVSGGVDSAVAAAIYANLLPRKNILLVNMPGEHTSQTTIDLANKLAENLNCLYAVIPTADSIKLTKENINGLHVSNGDGSVKFHLNLSPLMMENVQARDRSSRLLAAVASAFGGVFTCNSNKSEMTVGYSTLYGDVGGYFANLADIWKTEIYELAQYLNNEVFGKEAIPNGSIKIRPSAELNPDQNVDKDKGDPLVYPYHDALFQSWVESCNRATPEDILAWYCDGTLETKIRYNGKVKDVFKSDKEFLDDLEHWWNQYQGMGLIKRIQAPPVLAVKKRPFGYGQKESQMGPRYTRRYAALKKNLLADNAE